MTESDDVDRVSPADVTLSEWVLGYDILIEGQHVGSLETLPGKLKYINIPPSWERKGVARAALRAFIDLCRKQGFSSVTTTESLHPAMDHILETEGFVEDADGSGWSKDIV